MLIMGTFKNQKFLKVSFLLYRKFLKSSEMVYNVFETKNDMEVPHWE